MDRRPKKRRGPLLWLAGRSWRFWAGVALLTPLLYVASFGPTYWLISAGCFKKDSVQWLFRPLLRVRRAKPFLVMYAELGAAEFHQNGRTAPRRADIARGGFALDWHVVPSEWH